MLLSLLKKIKQQRDYIYIYIYFKKNAQFAFKYLKCALTFERTEIKALIITFVTDFTCIDHL